MKRLTAITAILVIAGFSLRAQNYFYSVFSGDTLLLNVANTGGGSIQWQTTMDTSSGNWTAIPGATGNNYQFIIPLWTGENFVRAEITNPAVCSTPYFGSTIKLRVVNSTMQINIGDYYAGGFVFHKDINGGGYVVSPNDISLAEWGCMGSITSALSPGFGFGQMNTVSIVSFGCIGASSICDTLTLYGYTDWFLPSPDELDSIYIRLSAFSYCNFGMGADPYWASFENSTDEASVQFFGTGLETTRFKNAPALVRAVRTYPPFSIAPPTVQQRLNGGESPLQIVNSGIQVDSLYGKTYQGGLIFYFDQITGKGLVAAQMEQSMSAIFGCMNTTIGTTSTNFGSGMINTSMIASMCSGPVIAAKVCDTLTLNGFNDWFLPSRDEIQFMKINLYSNGLGNFLGNSYWTSSEVSASNAWILSMSTGPMSASKTLSGAVRAVRAFNPNVQQRLNAGQTPLQIYKSGIQLDSLYGKIYQNGLIFYLDTATGSGLVSAIDEQSLLANWGCQGTFLNAGFSIIGSGKFNSDTIIAKCYSGSGAMHACVDYTLGGHNWYLPSKEEWLLMYQNLHMKGFGNFAATNYWTSTESDANSAWLMRVWNGDQITAIKDNTTYLRAIHAFGKPFTCPVKDIDGNEYPTTQIGSQIWMAANLKTERFNDGSPIPLVIDAPTWAALSTPAYCWYENDSAAYANPYGAMYNWYVVSNGNVCPSGWHVPSNAEFETLISLYSGWMVAGGDLKESGYLHWISPNTGATNSTGLTIVPSGNRSSSNGTFFQIGTYCYLHSADVFDTSNSYQYYLFNGSTEIINGNHSKLSGVAIRCVKD